MQEQPIPAAAVRDRNSVEMLRVWIAEQGLHCWIGVGVFRENQNVPEEKGWSTILADIARNVAQAIEQSTGAPAAQTLQTMREHIAAELDRPAPAVRGSFTGRH